MSQKWKKRTRKLKVKDNKNKADQDFSDYVQVNAQQEEGANVAEQADKPQQWELPQRVTRGAAASRGIVVEDIPLPKHCLLYTSPSPRDKRQSRMPSSA